MLCLSMQQQLSFSARRWVLLITPATGLVVMSRAFVLVALLALAGCVVAQTGAKVPPGKIKHFVVLMMENRAFDHMLGWMHAENPNIVGLNGTESNPWDYNNPSSEKVFITKTPDDVRIWDLRNT